MTDLTPPRRHRRSGLFLPFVLVLIALAVWTGWWFYLASQVRDRIEAQAVAAREAGWRVAYAGMHTTGWPFRTRVAAQYIKITSPSGQAVAAPRLVAEANTYDPKKWVLLAPDGLVLTRTGKGEVAINGQAIRASVHGMNQRFPNISVEMVNPVFTSHLDAEPFPLSRAGRVEAYLRPHRVAAPELAAAGVSHDKVDVLFRLIDARGRSGGPVEGVAQDKGLTLQIEAVVEQASRLRGADAAGVFGAWSRAGGRFADVRGEVKAGESAATFSSDGLSADPNGRLAGVLALKAERPLPAIAGLARSGSVAVNRAGAAGAVAATAIGGQGDMNLTLVFREGRTFLGPFALAPAPKLF